MSAAVDQSADYIARLPAEVSALVGSARLPQVYQQAKNALERCTTVDECAQWQNRATAMASYAKQAGDYSLEHMAHRIRLRALMKLGQLLAEIPQAVGSRSKTPAITRTTLCRAAGVQTSLGSRAVAMTRVPHDQREAMIERTPPATISEFERLGRPQSRRGNRELQWHPVLSWLEGFARWQRRHSAAEMAALPLTEQERLLPLLDQSLDWLTELKRALTP